MFTGLIEDVGRVKSIVKKGSSGRISINTGLDLASLKLGDSIAVNGVCLTATELGGGHFCAEVSLETLNVTTLGELKGGDPVNLERSLTPTKPMGGHMVSGHVDGVGSVAAIKTIDDCVDITINIPEVLMGQIVHKGSIAVDGISLTVAEVIGSAIRIALIPHTLKETNLSIAAPGRRVNVETDIIGKYVERYMEAYGLGGDEGGSKRKAQGSITEGFLSDHGFSK